MPTKDELEQENADLRARVAELEDQGAAPQAPQSRVPKRPTGPDGKPILSAGEAHDLAAHGTTVSPFTGETLDAITEGVEPSTPEALQRARRARAARSERVPAGPAPVAD